MPQHWVGWTQWPCQWECHCHWVHMYLHPCSPLDSTGDLFLLEGEHSAGGREGRAGWGAFILSIWGGSLEAVSEALRGRLTGIWGIHALPDLGGEVHPAAQAGLLMSPYWRPTCGSHLIRSWKGRELVILATNLSWLLPCKAPGGAGCESTHRQP